MVQQIWSASERLLWKRICKGAADYKPLNKSHYLAYKVYTFSMFMKDKRSGISEPTVFYGFVIPCYFPVQSNDVSLVLF